MHGSVKVSDFSLQSNIFAWKKLGNFLKKHFEEPHASLAYTAVLQPETIGIAICGNNQTSQLAMDHRNFQVATKYWQ